MKLSQTGMGTTKLNNIDEMYPGQSILLQTGQLVQYGAGIFGYNNVPLLVRRNIEKSVVRIDNKELRITASFGYAKVMGNTRDEFDEAFKFADKALYRAKRIGRNCVVMN